ncbi:Ku protein [Glycomyces sp. L485]|uniref:non-homologous end joining protein Ku n=1 Tax=Glycomyces sp. L485 TaxID=2909235 RepID=UPI001F4A0CBE|nr:Ku protein [Glycomyces sp. L485]MCH7231372.1 Ku protein [Glycomyces sp. L485]
MPAIWKGSIAFGLVSIPVSLRSATSSHDISMHQYHAADGGRIRYQKICELDDEAVEPEGIVKGVEAEDGEVVLLDEDDLEDLPVSSSKTIEVVQFVSGEQIDPIHYEKSYYVEPGKAAAKPYSLLHEALLDSGKIAIVKVTLRRRESLAALRPRDEVLVLHTMLWPDEIRRPEVGDLGGEARQQELDMAGTLIDTMTGDFRPEEYSDTYQEALQDLIVAKKDGRTEVAKSSKEKPKANVINLMDALKQSVEAKEGKRRPAKKAATRKKTAKKATARKKAAKKATARKRKSA